MGIGLTLLFEEFCCARNKSTGRFKFAQKEIN